MSKEKIHLSVPQSDGVIQSPDGSIQYYTSTPIKNKNNPYLYKSIVDDIESNIDSVDTYRPIECDGEIILILESNLDRAINLEYNASIVRLLCSLEFCMNLLVAFSTPYLAMSSIVVSLISLSGYYATYTYSRLGLLCYVVYQYIQTFGKITFLSLYIASAVSNEFKKQLNKNSIIIFYPTSGHIFILSLLTLGQIYITAYIQHFYYLLPNGRRHPGFRQSAFFH